MFRGLMKIINILLLCFVACTAITTMKPTDEGCPAAWDCYLHTDKERDIIEDLIECLDDNDHEGVELAKIEFDDLPITESDRYPIEDEILLGKEFSAARREEIYQLRKKERLAIIQLLLQPEFRSIEQNSYKRNALLDAARLGQLKLAQLLLENGAFIDAQSDEGLTALMIAIKPGKSPSMVKLLLDHGANLKIVSRSGETVFKRAEGNAAVAEMLSDFVLKKNMSTIRLAWMVGVARGIQKRYGLDAGAGSSNDTV